MSGVFEAAVKGKTRTSSKSCFFCFLQSLVFLFLTRPSQTTETLLRKHFCGSNVALNVFLFAGTRSNICCEYIFCFRETKNISELFVMFIAKGRET